MSRAFLFAALACAFTAQDGARPSFEVVSVKPATSGALGIGLWVYAGGRIHATNYQVRQLIHDAYDVEIWRVIGGPAWAGEDRFDVEGKPAESSDLARWAPVSAKSPPNAEMRLMLQSLLADRFHLKVHTEERKEQVYSLAAARGGHRLQPPAGNAVQPFVSFLPDGLLGRNATMDQLVERLARIMGRRVLNHTGIEGHFDFRIQYPPSDDVNDERTAMLSAIQEQCGLKLETQPGSVDYLVIDSVQKPSAN